MNTVPRIRVSLVSAAVMLLLGYSSGLCGAQSQDNSSVADAARKAREQKKIAPKAVRTLTNDDLPPAPEAKPAAAEVPQDQVLADRGKPAEGEATAEKKSAMDKPAGEKQASEERAAQRKTELEVALKRAKANLSESEHELDVLQRLAVLDSEAYYSQTNYQNDARGKAKLDADNQQIGEKKSQIDAIKTKIAELTSELGADAEPDKPSDDQPK
jgi:hypothetical protein